jgi:glycosyltransferase involved in cell wall biosynthesis
MSQSNPTQIDITMLVCTFNRAADLRELLQTALVQETDGEFSFEVLVVDNNSTDDTRAVVKEFIDQGYANLRYAFEGKPGKSHALLHGLEIARGWSYVITDDDFILPKDWLKKIIAAFKSHPDVPVISGKVLPLWQGEPPAWLTPEHWSAIAMADYGDAPFYADEKNQICLLACAFRLADVKAVGGYRPELGVSQKAIGGTEDLDILSRLWKAGRRAFYDPTIYFYHKVPSTRLTKAYHRRWHTEHGYHYALMRQEEFEDAGARLFDVPAHQYRQALQNLAQWFGKMLRGRRDAAFLHETRLRFFWGFFRQRRTEYKENTSHNIFSETSRFLRAVAKKKAPANSLTQTPPLVANESTREEI